MVEGGKVVKSCTSTIKIDKSWENLEKMRLVHASSIWFGSAEINCAQKFSHNRDAVRVPQV